MERFIRTILIVGGVLMVGMSLGFATEATWAQALWPNPDDKILSFKFVASMQAAIAAAMLWIGITGGLHMIQAGSLNLAVMFGGMGVSLLRYDDLLGDQTQLYAIGCLIFGAVNVLLVIWARRFPEPSQQPMPESMKWSYGLFVIALASVGAMLISQTPEIMPWYVTPLTSVLFGWMFFGDAFYFLYALVYPRWTNGAAQLWSFLAYDLILLGPFLSRRADIVAGNLPDQAWSLNSLTVYIAVLIFSCALAINYLILHPDTGVITALRNRGSQRTIQP